MLVNPHCDASGLPPSAHRRSSPHSSRANRRSPGSPAAGSALWQGRRRECPGGAAPQEYRPRGVEVTVGRHREEAEGITRTSADL